MEAKNYAENLIHKFTFTGGDLITCKRCATICVNEIIDEFIIMVPEPYKQHVRYLQEVKQHINSL